MNTIGSAMIEEPLGIMKKDTIELLKSIISEHDEIIAVNLYGSAVCGAENPADARFCGACGKRFGSD